MKQICTNFDKYTVQIMILKILGISYLVPTHNIDVINFTNSIEFNK